MAWVTGRTWNNEYITDAKLNEISTDINILGGDWTTYAPSWLASGTAPALGNGSLTGSSRTVGKTVDFRILFIAGSSTTYGTGVYNFTLPSAPSLSAWEPVGSCCPSDTSLGDHYGLIAVYSGGSNVTAFNGSGGRLSNTVPFTWANTDRLAITGRYTTV